MDARAQVETKAITVLTELVEVKGHAGDCVRVVVKVMGKDGALEVLDFDPRQFTSAVSSSDDSAFSLLVQSPSS